MKNTEIDLTRTASPLAGEGFLEKNVFSVKKFDDVVQQSNKNVSSISYIIVEVFVLVFVLLSFFSLVFIALLFEF
jgi:hypothetical protein